MIEAFEIVKGIESNQRLIILDTLIKNKNEIQFYFYSTIKKKILRKKQENISNQFTTLYLDKLINKSPETQILMINYRDQDDRKAEINKMNCCQVKKSVINKKQHDNYLLVSLDKFGSKFQLIKAVWTQNYCICEQFLDFSKQPNVGLNLPVTIKQSIGIVCDKIAKQTDKYYRGKTKRIELVFLKPNNLNVFYLLFIKRLEMLQNVIIRLNFISEQKKKINQSDEQSQTQANFLMERQPSSSRILRNTAPTRTRFIKSTNLICASCRTTNSNYKQFNQIPSHSVYKIQLKHSTAKRGLVQQSHNILEMYNFSKVCKDCYDKYINEVKKQDKYLSQTKYKNAVSFKCRNISRQKDQDSSDIMSKYKDRQRSTNKQYSRIEQQDIRTNIKINKGNRVYSIFKTTSKSLASESTKVIGYDSVLDISQISRKRN